MKLYKHEGKGRFTKHLPSVAEEVLFPTSYLPGCSSFLAGGCGSQAHVGSLFEAAGRTEAVLSEDTPLRRSPEAPSPEPAGTVLLISLRGVASVCAGQSCKSSRA